MNAYETSLIEETRNYIVVKSNNLVLNSRYQYTTNQQKMIAFICSKIKPILKNDKEQYQLEYEFEIIDYIRLMGIKKTGDAYNDIKAILKSLRDKSFWLELHNGSETTVSWINKVTISKKSGLVKYRLDEDLAPYLFELQEKYLSYGLINILNFKSKYSIRMYEMLKAHYNMKRSQYGKKRHETPTIEWVVDLDNLKHILMLDTETEKDKYKNFKDFRKKVLETAQKEINELSDTQFNFEPITKGRKTVKVMFIIKYKNSIERLESECKNQELFE